MRDKRDVMRKGSSFAVIVGCGTLGASIANMLSDAGKGVVIIDNNPDAFSKLSDSFGGITIEGSSADIAILDEANLSAAAVLIAVTGSDNANIMAAQIAKELYGVKKVIARLYDPQREAVYREFGISTISPVVLSTREVSIILGIQSQGEDFEL